MTNGAVVFNVAQFDPTTGSLIAERQWPDSPGAGQQFVPNAMDVAFYNPGGGVPPEWRVYIVGSQPGMNSQCDYATVAFAGDLSAVRWTERYNHDSSLWQVGQSGADIATAISVGQNCVAVVGTSEDPYTGVDIQPVIYKIDGTGLKYPAEKMRIPKNSVSLTDRPFGIYAAPSAAVGDVIMIGANVAIDATHTKIVGYYYELNSNHIIPLQTHVYSVPGGAAGTAMAALYGIGGNPSRNRMYATGYQYTAHGLKDMVTVRFDFATANHDASVVYDSGNGDDEGRAISYQLAKLGPLTAYADVVLSAGYKSASGGGHDLDAHLYTDDYPLSGGFQPRWQSAGVNQGADDTATAVDMFLGDDIDNGTNWYIAVTGQVGTTGNLGWYTALYAGQNYPTGPLATPRAFITFDGASSGDDVPVAIQEIYDNTLDNKYHLFVTGRSWSSLSSDDWQTHRYRFDP